MVHENIRVIEFYIVWTNILISTFVVFNNTSFYCCLSCSMRADGERCVHVLRRDKDRLSWHRAVYNTDLPDALSHTQYVHVDRSLGIRIWGPHETGLRIRHCGYDSVLWMEKDSLRLRLRWRCVSLLIILAFYLAHFIAQIHITLQYNITQNIWQTYTMY